MTKRIWLVPTSLSSKPIPQLGEIGREPPTLRPKVKGGFSLPQAVADAMEG